MSFETEGQKVWDAVSKLPGFDQRDVHLLQTLCNVADLETAALRAIKADVTNDKAHAVYARIVDKKHKLLDAFGLTPRSRLKLGEAPVDEVADDIREFATG